MKNKTDSEKLIKIILAAAEDKKAINPVVLDLKRLGKFADYMVFLSGDATPHLKAIAKEIEHKIKNLGIKGILWEGTSDSGWLIFDVGSIIVHIMSEESRKYFDLEELWGKEATIFHE